jgi:hypothetical protein
MSSNRYIPRCIHHHIRTYMQTPDTNVQPKFQSLHFSPHYLNLPLLTLPLPLRPLNHHYYFLHLLHLGILAFRIPLPCLQHQNPHQNECQNRIAGTQHPQRVLPPKHHRPRQRPLVHRPLPGPILHIRPCTSAHCPHPFDNIRNVDARADDIQRKRRAVEKDIGFRRPKELDEESEEAEEDDDVEEASDERRRLVDEAQVGFELVVVRGRDRRGGPEEGEVVGEGGKEDAEEEAGCCGGAVSLWVKEEGLRGRHTADDEEGGERAGPLVVAGARGFRPVYPPRHGCVGSNCWRAERGNVAATQD